MKIVQLNTRYKSGGAASVAREIHQWINSNTEDESVFLFGRGKFDNDGKIKKITSDRSVYYAALTARFLGKQVSVFDEKLVEEEIKSSSIVHFHNLHGYYVDYKKIIDIVIRNKKPIVWTFHDIWPITGRCAPPNECNKWKDGCKGCPHKDIYPKTFIDLSEKTYIEKKNIIRQLPKDSTIITCPSEWLKEQVKMSYLGDYDIRVVPNGIENNLVNINIAKDNLRTEFGLPKDKKLILFVAADPNDERKGIKHILEIMNEFDDDVMFVSVGNKIKEYLKSTKLVQLGYISDKEVLNKIYKACDLYVNPSLGETFSLTTVEAMSNGIPVVAFNVGPLPEMIKDKCGVVVNEINSENMKIALDSLIHNETIMKEFSQNAVREYLDRFTFNKFINGYMNIYSELK